MKVFVLLVQSNIYIALGAVLLAIQSQIQLGMSPGWHPYLFILFFATLFEYNLHRLITIISNKEALNSEKHQWVKQNMGGFYLLVGVSVARFVSAAMMAQRDVLIALSPVALLTLFYSMPVLGFKKRLFRLREIPYLKIFLIAFVWSYATIILPVIKANLAINQVQIGWMMMERFLFIFAITLPFDLRDKDADRLAGLKTIPILLKQDVVWKISYLALLLFLLIALIHYILVGMYWLSLALVVSAFITYFLLKSSRMRSWSYFHLGILDGTMLIQGLLVLIFYYFSRF